MLYTRTNARTYSGHKSIRLLSSFVQLGPWLVSSVARGLIYRVEPLPLTGRNIRTIVDNSFTKLQENALSCRFLANLTLPFFVSPDLSPRLFAEFVASTEANLDKHSKFPRAFAIVPAPRGNYRNPGKRQPTTPPRGGFTTAELEKLAGSPVSLLLFSFTLSRVEIAIRIVRALPPHRSY